jgi:hypothetical protein
MGRSTEQHEYQVQTSDTGNPNLIVALRYYFESSKLFVFEKIRFLQILEFDQKMIKNVIPDLKQL